MRWKRVKAEPALENAEQFVKITQLDVARFDWEARDPKRGVDSWIGGGVVNTLGKAQENGRRAIREYNARQAVKGRVWFLKLEEDNA